MIREWWDGGGGYLPDEEPKTLRSHVFGLCYALIYTAAMPRASVAVRFAAWCARLLFKVHDAKITVVMVLSGKKEG